jgi:hypothetical protein
MEETKGGPAGENKAHKRENATENFDAVTSWLSKNGLKPIRTVSSPIVGTMKLIQGRRL